MWNPSFAYDVCVCMCVSVCVRVRVCVYVCVCVCFINYFFLGLFAMSQYPTFHLSVIFSLPAWTQQSRVRKQPDGARVSGFLATEQNNSEIIAAAVYSSITQRAEPRGEGTFAFFWLQGGWTWWTNPGNLANASKTLPDQLKPRDSSRAQWEIQSRWPVVVSRFQN